MLFVKLIIFVAGFMGIVWVSRSSLRDVYSHGFYRFFAWEIILIMFTLNLNYWIRDPFSIRQIIAWTLLIISVILIVQGVQLFRQKGDIQEDRSDPSLIGIEKTTQLVTSGLYQYIRHPFYSSLLFLAWGILFKRIVWYELLLAIAATIFLVLTAKREEVENINFFGEAYREYIRRTKMFIPFVF